MSTVPFPLPRLRPLSGRVNLRHTRIVEAPAIPWETLPAHPSVAAQPTYEGRHVRAFTPHGDLLLFGYGDWGDNTGPISVVGYNLAGEPLTLLEDCPTEAFHRIVIEGGNAYLPYIDASGLDVAGFATDRDGVWELVEIGEHSAIHTFDVAVIGGRLHLCGSKYEDGSATVSRGVVWQEQPDRSWVKVLEAGSGSIPRFYKFYQGETAGSFRVQNRAVEPAETWVTTDGTTWALDEDAPDLFMPGDFELPDLSMPDGATAYAELGGWRWIGLPNGVVKRAPLS